MYEKDKLKKDCLFVEKLFLQEEGVAQTVDFFLLILSFSGY